MSTAPSSASNTHRSTREPEPPSRRTASTVLRDHPTRLDDRHRGARRRRDLRDDGVHRHPEPDHPLERGGCRRQQPRLPPGRRRHGADRRRHDGAVRPRHPPAVRVRRGPRHQLVPRRVGRRPGHLARGDGPRRHQRSHHRAARRHRPPAHDLRRRADPAEARDHGRHRPVHRVHRLRRRRLRHLDRRLVSAGRPRHRTARSPPCRRSIFVFTLLLDRRPGRPQGQGRHPHRPRHRHGRRRRRRGDLEHRPEVRRRRGQPRRLGPVGSRTAGVARERARPVARSARSRSARSSASACSPRSCSSSPSCSRTSSTRWAP